MTIIFEYRQVNDKVLIVQYRFDSHDVKVNGGQVNGYSLDKYISLDVWSQIYTKLEIPLDKYKSNIETRLKDETILMRRAQLELMVSWKSVQPYHREIIRLDKKNCDFCQYVMVVKIGMVSLHEKYKKQHSQEKLLDTNKESKPVNSTQRESDNSNGTRSSNGSTNDVEEYVPAARSNTNSSGVKYTPSTVMKSNENLLKTEEYTPFTKSIEDDIVTYTPTKISTTNIRSHKESTQTYKKENIKTDVNLNTWIEKKKSKSDATICELFGDSDGEIENPNRPNLRSKSSVINPKTPKPQNNLDNWVNSKRQTSQKPTDTIDTRKRKIDVVSSIDMNSEKPSQKPKQLDEEAKKLRKLREELEQMEKFPTVNEIMNIKDLSEDDLMETFDEHEECLRKIFEKHIKTADHLINPTPNDLDYLLILDGLVEPKQQKQMYKKIRAKFCKSSTNNITSNHENLFWRYIIPEWALLIFMDKFFFTHEEAIERLKLQDQAKINDDSYGFGLSF